MRTVQAISALAPVLAVLGAPALWADTIVAARTIPARTILAPGDLSTRPGPQPDGAVPKDLIGQEARITLYVGRSVQAADLAPAAVVERNQIVPLIFRSGTLHIVAEGRALDRAGPGEVIRVMNLSSRATLFGRVGSDGNILISP